MYEFPAKIQEAMYQACNFIDEQALNLLWQYKIKEKIQSEEYIYILAQAYITNFQYERVSNLIEILKKGSVRGKRSAKILQEMLEGSMDVMDD